MGLTSEELRTRVSGLFPSATVFDDGLARGQAVVVVPRDDAAAVLQGLRDHPDLAFDFLSDLTVVDYLGRTPRYEVVYQLYSIAKNHRLRVKVPLAEDDAVVPSAAGIWKSANWGEREAFDMFGIRFAGHPDLRRILMYPEFTGFPLRKDYPVARREPLVPERDPIGQPWYPRGREEAI